MAHPNVALLRDMDQAMARGDVEGMFAAFAPDVIVHMGGASKLSGEFRGVDQLQQMFGRFMEASGEYSFENHAYLADDEHGVILQRGTMRRDPQTFATNEVFVYHFRDGKISEFWYLPEDQSGLDAWWGQSPERK
ncbi:MAG: nuclear transport factor 2 family protein [Candidatus Dormibacteraeota bacterium]|nr:nuclear transport factor 2 family protein [Candidatus Dormibacteraeota bacterium]